MKVLVFDSDHCGLPFSLHAQRAGHEVRLWQPLEKGTADQSPIGRGLVNCIADWVPSMRWADIIVMTDNSKYGDMIEPFFRRGFPIFGCNKEAAKLELDREVGINLLDKCGIATLPFETFTSYDDAIAHVKKTCETFVSKPWGGNPDKSLSYVSKSPADMVFKLESWKRSGRLKGKLLLQKAVKGAEMAVGGWLSENGWSQWINENWEEKRLMNEGLGVNTGEMGTVMRYTKRSKLFDEVLKPCTDRLLATGYRGYVDMNCIVGEDGTPWPLEFTMRFGWPHFNLCMALHEGDPLDWMAALLEGKDRLKCKTDVCVGVVMAHGDFPYGNFPPEKTVGFPLTGLTEANEKSIWLSSVMESSAPVMLGGKVKMANTICTAGDYVLIATGLGETVEAAQEAVYKTAWGVNWPSNRMFRTDIGERLEEGLPALQKWGYAKGMKYE
jgi:phosphoribosylamine---glycine ligase